VSASSERDVRGPLAPRTALLFAPIFPDAFDFGGSMRPKRPWRRQLMAQANLDDWRLAFSLFFSHHQIENARVPANNWPLALSIEDVSAPNYVGMLGDPTAWLSVTPDRERFFRIPKPERLRAIGSEARYALALADISIQAEVRSGNGNALEGGPVRRINTAAGFLVWDYHTEDTLVFGDALVHATFEDVLDAEHTRKIVKALTEEILSEPPFVAGE
jgi:hypothetical protein